MPEIAKETTQERFYKMAREAGEYAKEHPELGPVEREPIGKVLWEGLKGLVGRRYETLKGEVLGLPEELRQAKITPEVALEQVLAFGPLPLGMTKGLFIKQLGKSFKTHVAGRSAGMQVAPPPGRKILRMRARGELRPLLREAKILPKEMYASTEVLRGTRRAKVDWAGRAKTSEKQALGGEVGREVPVFINWEKVLREGLVAEEVAHTTQFAPQLFWGKKVPKKVEALRMEAVRLRNYVSREFDRSTAYELDPMERGLDLFKEVVRSRAKMKAPITYGEAKNLYIQSLKWGIADTEAALTRMKKLEMGPR